MTKKTIELVENKGYRLYKVEVNEITKRHVYYFSPNILEGNHYEVVVNYKEKNNEHTLIKVITDGQGNRYNSYLIDDIRNTNTFKKMIKELL